MILTILTILCFVEMANYDLGKAKKLIIETGNNFYLFQYSMLKKTKSWPLVYCKLAVKKKQIFRCNNERGQCTTASPYQCQFVRDIAWTRF